MHKPHRTITLFCWIRDVSHVPFPVDIEDSKTVGHLKQEIVKDSPAVFANVNVSDLTLWMLREPRLIAHEGNLWERIGPVCASLSDHADMLGESTARLSTLFQGDPSQDHLYVIAEVPTAPNVHQLYTDQWTALMHSSEFRDASGAVTSEPVADGVLRVPAPLTMLSIGHKRPVSVIFIRECYISWFRLFLAATHNRPKGKFALSSTPGCGKTTANNFIFKMAASHPSLSHKPILYQFEDHFYHIQSNRVYLVNREAAAMIAGLPDTFYVIDGHNAHPVISECLTLFISSPRSDHFKDWHYHAEIIPLYLPVWSLEELRHCRDQCYSTIDAKVLDRRYERYGGNAGYVLWSNGEPPAIESVIADRFPQ